MPIEYLDEDGNKLEGFTQEELDEAREEAKEEITTEHEESKQELESQIEEQKKLVEEKEEELSKAANKDTNFKKLRDSKNEAEKKLTDLESKIDEKLQGIESKINDSGMERMFNEAAKGDKDLAEKVKVAYNSFKGEPKDAKEVEERLSNAVTLAGGNTAVNPLNAPGVGAGAGSPPGGQLISKGKISESAKDILPKLGITEEEAKEGGII